MMGSSRSRTFLRGKPNSTRVLALVDWTSDSRMVSFALSTLHDARMGEMGSKGGSKAHAAHRAEQSVRPAVENNK